MVLYYRQHGTFEPQTPAGTVWGRNCRIADYTARSGKERGAPFLSDVSHQWRYMPFTKEQWDAAVFQAPESLIQVSLQRIVRAR